MPTKTLQRPSKEEVAEQTVELLSGEEVLDLLNDQDFIRQWDCLYQSCPWGTVFQSSRFVVAWYRIYEKEYLPILIKESQDGLLTGLLTLAMPKALSVESNIHNRHPLIMGAGMYEAEYQTWLALPHRNDAFTQQAFGEISKRFPKKDILLRFLPPEVPLGWISESPRWKQKIELQAFKRPIMDLHAPDVTRMFRKTEFRNKLNRIKRLGNFSFDQITDIKVLQAIMEELTDQYDFRQGAMFNINQFRDNPLKAAFLLEMFRQGLLHVTVLKADNQIIACIMAVQGGEWVHLAGINIHSPFYANFSPGFVHFLLLGQQLSQEGTTYFDLTPGGDPYKERMANRHDTVHELVICNNMPYRAKRFLRKNIHGLLTKAGIRPMSFELSLAKRLYLLKGKLRAALEQGLITSIVRKVKASSMDSHNRILQIQPSEQLLDEQVHLQQNNLSDILNYAQQGSPITRWEFTEDAMHRFETGQRAYTWSEDNRLLACVWLSITKPGQETTGLPEGAAMLENLYCHPDGLAHVLAFLSAVAVCVNKPVYLAEQLNVHTWDCVRTLAAQQDALQAESYYIISQQGAV